GDRLSGADRGNGQRGSRAGPARRGGCARGLQGLQLPGMKPDSLIYVAGHRGLVGSAIVRRLRAAGFGNLLLRERRELDLTRQAAVEDFFAAARPEYVFLAAAKVGGILANDTRPGGLL